MGQPEPESITSPRRPAVFAAIWRRGEPVLWTALIVVVIAVQWPMLKGWYYKTTGSVAPPSAVVWRADVERALGDARTSRTFVLLYFSADWCPPCVAMKHDVWPHQDVAAAVSAGFVPVLVDADGDSVHSSHYQVSAIPTLLLLDADGRVVARHEGFLSRARLIRFLREANR